MRAKIFQGTVLLVTSSGYLKDRLQKALLQAGYGIRTVRSQEDAFTVMQDINPAILVVDRRESGFSRLHHEMPLHLPIVTVMYHADVCDEQHCVIDLEEGAARAVCNASPAMIVALLGAVLRRQRGERTVPERYVADGVTIDLQRYEVMAGATSVQTSQTEFRILKSLVAAPGHFLSRKALLDHVWGEGFSVCPHTLDVHISALRRKLNPNGSSPEVILTLKGLGFKLRSAALPAETSVLQPYRSAAFMVSHLSPRPYLPRTQTVHESRLGSSRWRHKPDHQPSARYRVKPVSPHDHR